MKIENPFETLVGAVVVAVAVGFALYASNSSPGSSAGGYDLIAEFRSVEGVTPGADVRIAGVRVGSVKQVSLNQERARARVILAVENGVLVPEDSSAKIASDGLLGSAYLSIEPGVSDILLEGGEEIELTQGSVNFMDLIARAIHTTAGGGAE
ncbi:MAG: outer membrane lipid asymmetry maintenance protein MlaD [Neomegalonema sp.]|nr:outer membrane lipid asymmetry maintenance protein MlaD [Neomegalonema sp.]